MKKIDQIVNLIKKNFLVGEGNNLIDKEQVLNEYPELKSVITELNDRGKLMSEYETYKKLRKDRANRQQHMLDNILYSVRSADHSRLHRRRVIFLKVAAFAASICICFGLLYWKFAYQGVPVESEHAISEFSGIKPGNNNASLLIQGMDEPIDLKSDQAGIAIGDHIQYRNGTKVDKANEIVLSNPMMTLSTPRGGEYQIILSDGTQVTLNADSKLTYPRTFNGDQRIVELQGEAYFEVAKEKETSFIVKTKNEAVRVLGTHFNVNAYPEDTYSYVSLIEGRVEVSTAMSSNVLSPGQQAVTTDNNMTVQQINIDEAIAWKNGEFMFNNENLESVMHKLSRWYDIEAIVSPDLKHMSIWGSVSRYDSFDKVLEVIKLLNKTIKFRKEGRRVYIMK